MSKILSIVIPFYKETEQVIFPLLSTISTQKGIDFSKIEVILVNDGYKKMKVSKDFFSIFPHLEISVIQLSANKGPGMARQFGLDAAIGKYVMFCDCDDLLQNVGVLGVMIQEMEVTNAQYLSTPWLEELEENGAIRFVPHELEATWLHGKMFLRSFLVENNIRFHENLRVHEDTYFLSLVCDLATEKRYLPTTSYIWQFSNDSITRKDEGIYSFNSMDVFVQAVCNSIKELKKRGKTEILSYKVIQLLSYIYLITQSQMWREEEVSFYLKRMNDAVTIHMEGLWDIWDNADADFIKQVYFEEFVKASRDFAVQSFHDWVAERRICKKES